MFCHDCKMERLVQSLSRPLREPISLHLGNLVHCRQKCVPLSTLSIRSLGPLVLITSSGCQYSHQLCGFFLPYLCYISFPACYKPRGNFYQAIFYNHLGHWREKSALSSHCAFIKCCHFFFSRRVASFKLGVLKFT